MIILLVIDTAVKKGHMERDCPDNQNAGNAGNNGSFSNNAYMVKIIHPGIVNP